MSADPEQAVVVLAVPGGDVDAVRRLHPGAEVVPVTQQSGDGLAVFPLGTCYARNRGAMVTTARELVFVDSDEPNRRLVFDRDEFFRHGGFDHALGFETTRLGPHDAELADRVGRPVAARTSFARADAVAAGRTARRLRSGRLALRAAVRGGLAGLLGRDLWRPPSPARELGQLSPLGTSNPAKTHFLYAAGADAIAHLYVNPSARLRRALAEREQIRARVGGGVPAVRDTVEAHDAVWIVEDRLLGIVPSPDAADTWFPRVREWLLRFVDPSGTPLAAATTWREHAAELTDAFAIDALPRALERVAALPAVAMHGDLQRRNVLLDGDRVAAVDWEGAWRDGIPGLDLLYLALFARTDEPDFHVLDALEDLRPALAGLGVTEDVLPATLLVVLATWALSERRRRARLGAPPPPPVFERELERRATVLAAGV